MPPLIWKECVANNGGVRRADQPSHTKSAAAQEDKQRSVWKEEAEGVAVALSASTDATRTSQTARPKDVDAVGRSLC